MGRRRVVSWLAALAIPLAILGVTIVPTRRDVGHRRSECPVLHRLLVVALLGGIAPALLSAVLSGLLLLYFLVTPLYTLTTDDPDGAITIVVLLLVAMAVAALVDKVANRAAEARRSSQEAELLALFADSVLRDGRSRHAAGADSRSVFPTRREHVGGAQRRTYR